MPCKLSPDQTHLLGLYYSGNWQLCQFHLLFSVVSQQLTVAEVPKLLMSCYWLVWLQEVWSVTLFCLAPGPQWMYLQLCHFVYCLSGSYWSSVIPAWVDKYLLLFHYQHDTDWIAKHVFFGHMCIIFVFNPSLKSRTNVIYAFHFQTLIKLWQTHLEFQNIWIYCTNLSRMLGSDRSCSWPLMTRQRYAIMKELQLSLFVTPIMLEATQLSQISKLGGVGHCFAWQEYLSI